MNPTKKGIFLPANSVVASVSLVNSVSVTSPSQRVDNSEHIQDTSLVDKNMDKDTFNFNLYNSDLTDQQKSTLTRFLNKNRKVFAKDMSELGHTDVYQHKIDTGNVPPIRKRFYGQSPHVLEKMNKQIEELLKYDIIGESNSEWGTSRYQEVTRTFQDQVQTCETINRQLREKLEKNQTSNNYEIVKCRLNQLQIENQRLSNKLREAKQHSNVGLTQPNRENNLRNRHNQWNHHQPMHNRQNVYSADDMKDKMKVVQQTLSEFRKDVENKLSTLNFSDRH
ncbi:unnamed protein product [Mytilus coruscus]|uniref:Uncharacterized protein n=1 Tax=Mytilus coruscus TaxID=42192 RepID=A0A6J8CRD5_MYTCO|nr:unnamed protein product [Mytilus coruscus]